MNGRNTAKESNEEFMVFIYDGWVDACVDVRLRAGRGADPSGQACPSRRAASV